LGALEHQRLGAHGGRAKRGLFNALSIVSLLLFILTGSIWVRSQQASDLVWNGSATGEWGALFSTSAVYFYKEKVIGAFRLKPPFGWGHATQRTFSEYRPPKVDEDWGGGGFHWVAGRDGFTNQTFLSIPYWSILSVSLLSPCTWSIYQFRRRFLQDTGSTSMLLS
jgi:hypothetical protein